jgi:hypothetical protein
VITKTFPNFIEKLVELTELMLSKKTIDTSLIDLTLFVCLNLTRYSMTELKVEKQVLIFKVNCNMITVINQTMTNYDSETYKLLDGHRKTSLMMLLSIQKINGNRN